MERFVTIAIITKRSILDVATVLDQPLIQITTKSWWLFYRDNKLINFFHYWSLYIEALCKICQDTVFIWSIDCVKSVRIRSYSGPYFPAFGLKMERYGVSRRSQFECGKIRTRITPNTDTLHAVIDSVHMR